MKKANVTFEIIIAVAGLIIAILSLAIGTVQYRYSVSGVDSAYQWNTSYKVNQTTAAIATTKHWTKGNVYYGVNQASGTEKTKYSIYYRKNSNNYVLEYNNGYTSKNNTYYGEYLAHSTNGTDKYSYKLVKNTNKNVASKMVVDLFVQ